MAGTHAKLSASSSERFMECPGSVLLSEHLPPDEESEYAAEGTAAHALGQKALESGEDTWAFAGELMYTDEVGRDHFATPDMVTHVQGYVNYVQEQAAGCKVHVELSLHDEELGDDMGGTADAVINGYVQPDKDGNCGFLHIIDLKYGAGLPVEVEGNSQLRYYAYLALRKFGITADHKMGVGISVYQPRAPHHEGPARTEWSTAAKIIHWAETELLPAVEKVRQRVEEYRPGEHCRWCPAKLLCPKLRESYETVAEADPKQVTGADDSALAVWFEQIKAAETFIKAVKAECLKRAMQGAPVAGTKLIVGRSDRVWTDGAEEKAAELFGEDAYSEPTFRSPAQIEKLPGGKDFAAEFAYKPEGRPSLVSADAKGVPYIPAERGAGFAAIDTPTD